MERGTRLCVTALNSSSRPGAKGFAETPPSARGRDMHVRRLRHPATGQEQRSKSVLSFRDLGGIRQTRTQSQAAKFSLLDSRLTVG